MPLRVDSWKIHANGHRGTLDITGVNAQGIVSGQAFGNGVNGFWDEDAKKITFMRVPNPSDPSTIQVYTGCLFDNQAGSDHKEFMAGTFEAFSSSGGTRQRTVFGWSAEVEVVD